MIASRAFKLRRLQNGPTSPLLLTFGHGKFHWMPNAAFQFISVNGTSAKDRTAEGVLPAPGL
jgi:hypothetical protein